MEFVAIDVETANADLSSICQIGIAQYREGAIVDEWVSLVDPEDYFDPVNVSIHGIDKSDIKGAPTLANLADNLYQWLNGRITVCHTHFDRTAIGRACEKYGIAPPECNWLDSASVTRRTWSEFAERGYGLASVCEFLSYDFNHHDALEDAKAAGHILLRAVEATGISVEAWLQRVKQPISTYSTKEMIRASVGNQAGPYFGERLVFTGQLRIPRADAAKLAAELGFSVDDGVTRHTTYLVVGDQDVVKLAGHDKSSKHRKAEALIRKGQQIRILRESDFARLGSA